MATQHIIASAAQNTHLLSILSQTDHAPSDYAQITQYQLSVERIVLEQEKRVKTLVAASAKEHQDHEEYKDSTVKRLAYKLSGRKQKFIEKEEKEHREWLNAIQNELEAKRHLSHLKDTLQEAKSKASSLKPLVEKHNAAQAELDTLYNSIFSGPSPDFPTEDTMEHLLSLAKDSFDEGQLQLSIESNVLSILQNASTIMRQCVAALDNALQSSNMDAWGVGGGFADMTERSSLAQAQSFSSQVEMLISQARQIQPAVQPLGPMNIAQGSLMSDVIFDNILSDLKFDEKIEELKRQLVAARSRLIQETKHSNERLMSFRVEVGERKKVLETKRKEMQDERAAVFERVVAHDGIAYNSQEPRSTVQVEHDQSGWQSPAPQWDSQQHIHYSLFGGGYKEQSNQFEPYHIPPAGTYDSLPVDSNYSQQDLSMPAPSWYTS
ncbi:89ec1803-e9fc-4d97-9585-d35e23370b19 [Sclerotinia trifoliorum]|uniref:89ec1803-e9fc-4d97-9585-d35e23370b19 n=1 Tax=Sclerotinia trifoliorum TaxID=28548 RepID=A0A8H2W3Q8_9HELO|nr:89ec1803-e9fc-4d97-9585-d35e23370b19 [Sclerotinia trifoliorum]